VREEDSTDHESARHWIKEYCRIPYCQHVGDEYFAKFKDKLSRRAFRFMRAHAEEVRAIAELLLRHRTLEGDDVRTALGI
jgi:hypothetical protein